MSQYGKTIQMLILGKVNGYYSPNSLQTIMEEEARSRYSDIFTLAEKEFFKHRLLTLYPKITGKGIESSINFLEQQKWSTAHVLFTQNKEAMNALSSGDNLTGKSVMMH